MNLSKSVIILEFNELCPSLLDLFIQENKLPNFKKLYESSQIYITDAEEEPPYLEPWIQWVTIHSGLSYHQHQVFHLDDGYKLQSPYIWDILSEAGLQVWICGSMNIRYNSSLNGYVLPDFWTTKTASNSEELLPYFRFVQRQVQEHTNDSAPINYRDYMRFLLYISKHGLSISTINNILGQIIRERFTRKYSWQRVAIADKLQFDLFRWIYQKYKPNFSTFFLNSTAHLQHLYWRNMEPDKFRLKPSLEEQIEYEKAILFGYQKMDKLIGKFLKLLDNNTTLILATGLSQQPCLSYENIGGKRAYRPYKLEELLNFIGIKSKYTCSSVMAEEFRIWFENEQDAVEAEQRLLALQINQLPVMRLKRDTSEIFCSCGIFNQLSHDTIISISNSEDSIPFFQVFYQIEDIKSGMHHPDGVLWIRNPNCQHAIYTDKVSLLSIAPTILNVFNIPKLDNMNGIALT